MPGMNSGLNPGDPTLVAAFKSALLHQGAIALLMLVFVWLLGSKAGAAKAFLIGNLGFWIEKVPLSVPGGLVLLFRRDPALRPVTRADLEQVRRAAESGPTGTALTRGGAS